MLMRYDPFREIDRFTDQLFGNSLGTRRPWMPMDAVRREGSVDLWFDVPGVDPADINVNVERNVLTIKADRSWFPAEGEETLARERTHGSFTRQIFLGEALDVDKLEASYENGVLKIHVPVAEEAKPRKVEIEVGGRTPITVGSGTSSD